MEDAAAINAVRNGDAEAYAAVVERYQDVAFRTAYLVVRDAATAEDVAQEGFIRAYQQLDRFRIQEPSRPWLLRIVTNLALKEACARTPSRATGTSAADTSERVARSRACRRTERATT